MFTPIASTRKACLPAIMEQESIYLSALQAAKKYQINPNGELEIVYQNEGRTGVMMFKHSAGKTPD